MRNCLGLCLLLLLAVPAAADVPAVVESNNQLAFDLYAQLRAKKGNLFFSPVSVCSALAVTAAGARGETLDEMTRALHFPQPDKLHPGAGALVRELNDRRLGLVGRLAGAFRKARPGPTLHLASALWVHRDHPFLPAFLRFVAAHYGPWLGEADFARDPVGSFGQINRWVDERTNGRIPQILEPRQVPPTTRLVLTSAVHFQGDWASRFDPESTRVSDFHPGAGKPVQVPLMRQRGSFGYLKEDGVQVLELPYAGKGLSMVVLLPDAPTGLAGLEKDLSAEKVDGWLKQLRETTVEVALPRYRLTGALNLKKPLAGLGLAKVFTPEADFSGMDGQKRLYLSTFVHKAFVDVHEEGTEAAAASAVGFLTLSAPPPAPAFRADRPFVFLIRDTKRGTILFLGRYSGPEKEARSTSEGS
jgi:serpin B